LNYFTASDWGTSSQVADVVVRTGAVGVEAAEHWVAGVHGTVVVVFTEQNLSANTAKQLIASFFKANRAVVTDHTFRPIAMEGSRRGELDATIDSTS